MAQTNLQTRTRSVSDVPGEMMDGRLGNNGFFLMPWVTGKMNFVDGMLTDAKVFDGVAMKTGRKCVKSLGRGLMGKQDVR